MAFLVARATGQDSPGQSHCQPRSSSCATLCLQLLVQDLAGLPELPKQLCGLPSPRDGPRIRDAPFGGGGSVACGASAMYQQQLGRQRPFSGSSLGPCSSRPRAGRSLVVVHRCVLAASSSAARVRLPGPPSPLARAPHRLLGSALSPGRTRRPDCRRLDERVHIPLPHPPAASSFAEAGGDASSGGQPVQQDYKPFNRLKERDPYRWVMSQTPRRGVSACALMPISGGCLRGSQCATSWADGLRNATPGLAVRRLLGLGRDAGFEEVQDARNYLFETYRWHEPSREAIELAFDTVIQVRACGKLQGVCVPGQVGVYAVRPQ